jgi:diamine N-acetyltransferase
MDGNMFEIFDITIDKINCIRNLWEKLNKIHYEESVYFEDYYESFTFKKRIGYFKNIDKNDIKISIVKDGPRFLGYCISTKQKLKGEIESIYLEEEIQGRGIGKRLANEHLGWLKENGCEKIGVAVSYGHENEVKEFYNKMGFYECLVYFEMKD